nr:hypothetical protein [Tanacetum cinerariifolium]
MDNLVDEAVHKELGDSLLRAAITTSSLGAEQDNGNINMTQSKATPNESSSQETNSEKTKTTQHNEIATQQKEIASLKRRVKQIKKKNRSRNHRLKRLYKVGLSARIESYGDEVSLGEDASKQGRIDAIDLDEEITLVSVQNDADKEMFDVDALNIEVSNTAKLIIDGAQVSVAGDIVSTASIPFSAISVATTVSTATTTTATIIIVDDVTLDQALKEIKRYKLKDLKLKECDYIQEMFDRAFKRVNTFEDFRTKLVKGKEKRAETKLIQKITKKQKVEDDKEIAELKQFMEIIPDEEEVAIDAIPLAVKSPKIIDWKIYKEGRKSYYQIIRADGKSQMYMSTFLDDAIYADLDVGREEKLDDFEEEYQV